MSRVLLALWVAWVAWQEIERGNAWGLLVLAVIGLAFLALEPEDAGRMSAGWRRRMRRRYE